MLYITFPKPHKCTTGNLYSLTNVVFLPPSLPAPGNHDFWLRFHIVECEICFLLLFQGIFYFSFVFFFDSLVLWEYIV